MGSAGHEFLDFVGVEKDVEHVFVLSVDAEETMKRGDDAMVRRPGLAPITILITIPALLSAPMAEAGLRRHQFHPDCRSHGDKPFHGGACIGTKSDDSNCDGRGKCAVRQPLTFEKNRGQADEAVQFLARAAGYSARFTASDMELRLSDGRHQTAVVRLKPLGANHAPRLVGDDTRRRSLPNAHGDGSDSATSATTYGGVRYANLYPGIDLVYYGRRQRVEYDFVVAPGADPDRIVLAFEGAARPAVDAAGTLVAHTAAGMLRQPRPVAYQEIDGTRHSIDASYLVDRAGRVRFLLAAYDRSRPLVIDPLIDYATYLGGTFDDADEPFEGIEGVAVDGAGNFYVTGTTQSADFPTTAGADRTLDGSRDIFVTKFSPAGAILYSTYLGGGCDDSARDIAVDVAGNAYVTGRFNGGSCYTELAGALVAKLDPVGAVVYASVLGGSLADSSVGQAIAVDAAGHAYVTGITSSASHDFPTTPGAYRTGECDNVLRFANDGFVAKLSTDGGTLLYSTLLCGGGDDSPGGIAVDAAGSAYVAGATGSSDFPTVNPFQATRGGGPVGITGFVSKLTPDGAQLVYSTYLGGSESQAVGGIAVDEQGNAYVTGVTASSDFPTTPGVLQEYAGNRLCIEGCTDAFVTKLDPSGSALVYSTYLFGELDDAGSRIAVDRGGNAYVVGTTNSSYFPIVDAFQASNRGLDDVFVAKLDPDGKRLVYSSYLGGSRAAPSPRTGVDEGWSLALDPSGNAYVVGYTQSYDFPTTPGAFQPALGAGICDVFGTPCGDAFVVKVTASGPGVAPPVRLTVTPAAAPPGGTVTATWAGIPLPTAEDHLRLYALGSPDGYPGEILAWWPTTGTAAGQLLLALPDGPWAGGWYELRLYSPDPNFSNLPVVVARSEPIRIDGSAPPAPPTTTATPSSTPTFTATAPPTNPPTATPLQGDSPTPTPTPGACTGDCDDSGDVTVNEIITLANIALGTARPSACACGVPGGAEADVALIIQAVNNALNGCSRASGSGCSSALSTRFQGHSTRSESGQHPRTVCRSWLSITLG
jgi:hypothetical protein